MSELRWHPLQCEWVTGAPWRQDRTYHPPAEFCPLCPTRPGGLETEVPFPDYHIAVFENRFPSYTRQEGRCEVVCYTAEHESSLGRQPVEHIRDLIEVWAHRTLELAQLPNVRYVYVFENRGEEIGVTLPHPHGQIYAYPFLPPILARECTAFAEHHRRTRHCLYCDLLAQEGEERLVARQNAWRAFVPAFNRWPYEVHIAPHDHLASLSDLDLRQQTDLGRVLKEVVQRYDRLFHKPMPYVMAVHQRPPGRGNRHFHLHFEFYPALRSADKLKYSAGSELGAGAWILDQRAEDSAAELRSA